MNFIRQIVEKKTDDAVHKKLARYGKGEYDRGILLLSKTKSGIKLKASWDWSNDLFGIVADNIKKSAEVKGKIIAPRDFKSELGVDSAFSKRGKLYTAEIEANMTPEQMKSIYDKFKHDFLLLNIKSDDFKLSVKNAIPKPGGAIKEDFCSASLPLDSLDEFAFDFDKNFSEAKIVNKFLITELVVPKQYESDFAMARLMAKRKGKLVRVITVDGKEVKKEYAMEA
ncbi:hypothetical protein FJZ53_05180 [Candidatus Woesearchaeota archaeon]|nr:hypothetical protein [Candidatus Woesearchaeota archaeon]